MRTQNAPDSPWDVREPVGGWPSAQRGTSATGEFPAASAGAAPFAAASDSYSTGSGSYPTVSDSHSAGFGPYPNGSGSQSIVSDSVSTGSNGYSNGSFSGGSFPSNPGAFEPGWPDNSVGNGQGADSQASNGPVGNALVANGLAGNGLAGNGLAGNGLAGNGLASKVGWADGAWADSGRPDAGRADIGWADSGRADDGRRERGAVGTGSRALPGEQLPPRQSRLVTLGMVVLGVVVLLAGTVIGVVYFSGDDKSLPSMLNLGGDDSAKRTVSAPLDNRTAASFELLAAVNTVHVTIGELGDDLYRISTPDDAGIKPSPVVKNNDVQLQVTKDGAGTGGEIEVVLSAAVRWQLRFSGYADQQNIDLSDGQVAGVEMVAGMHKAELELPTPSGTVPVTITGAVDQLTVRSPADSPVRVKVGGGATNVVAGSRSLHDMPPGSTLTPKEWKTESNRYDVTATATIGSLNVENLTQ